MVVIRLTLNFAACNSHKHHAIPKTTPRVQRCTAADLNCLAAETIVKGVKDFSKLLEDSVSARLTEGILNIKCDH